MVDSILIEARPFIKTCNVSIELTHVSNANVQVKNNVLIVENEIFIVGNLDMNECDSLKLTRNGKFVSFNAKFLNLREIKSKWSFEPPVIAGHPVSISCLCGSSLVDNFSFDRVLPLPSFRWESADVFCHGHQSETDRAFRQRDFLYGTHFFQISRDVLNRGVCTKCGAEFGKISRDYLKIWTSGVRFGPCEKKNLLQDFLPILGEIFFSPSVNWVKILLYTEDHKYLAMNVLEKDLQVFRLFKQNGSNDRVLSQDCMMKVDYCYYDKETELVQELQKDLSVNTIQVPLILLDKVLEHLEAEHRQLHPNFNKIGEKLLSYLPSHSFHS